ncbi:uncharacterized protein LOC123666030 [Melitaea cinxia]|uniref:uncharacterized protein LOC123666030 n=1 Tax=Melitaea cinxia TaxID=113334 RepID=UPI001E272172|nr:uncharacterized protein LOC123666030 [Melitaea cinxia]
MTEASSVSTVNAKELKDLCVRRSSVKGRITKFKTYLNSISSIGLTPLQIGELQLKVDKIKKLSDDFDMLQSRIEVLNFENMTSELIERDNIEQDFCITIATGLQIIQNNQKDTSNTSSPREDQTILEHSCCNHDRHEVNFKLPQIQISKFDGSYFRWLDFRDSFLSLVHNNNRLQAIHKFHYLVSYLEGDAARIVSNIEISEANYNDAWLLLCERYDNKKQLITHHLSALFNINTVARESERSLRFLVDHVTKNLRALATLGEPTDKWDTLIIHMVSSKLDNVTMVKWQEYRNTLDDVPTLKQFHKFLSDRSDVLESLNRNKPDKILSQSRPAIPLIRKNNFGERQLKSFAATSQINYRCVLCKGDHRIYNCPIFLNKNVEERKIEVSKLNLCPNCLRFGHSIRECHLGPCRECNKRHNTLLHITKNKTSSKIPTVENDTNLSNNHSLANFSKQNFNQIILSTALINVTNPNTNQSKTVRALLDCGSQSSFITQSLKQSLSLDSNPIHTINVIGIGNNSCDKVTESCNLKFNSLVNKDFSISLSCLVLKNLSGEIPIQSINIQQFKLPKNIQLADPTFDQPAPVEIIIGADVFWDILGSEQRSLGPNNPKLRSSKLGWLIGGPISTSTNIHKSNYNQCLSNLSYFNKIDSQLSKFWELESVPQDPILSDADKECENHFIRHTYRLPSGRFCVRLPLANTPDVLGDSYTLAKRRFLNLEKRLNKKPEMKSQYSNFINEYAQLGHLEKISTSNLGTSYFLCHHAVFKANSESTKLRVVFDGSARTSSGLSVNDIQLKGPNIQDSLFSILIRARQYKYLLTGDIEKMYRQILLHEEDRNLQLILWREDESKPLETYRLNTVTYGFKSASYLSTRCLWQLGEECDDDLIKTIIQHDFYVDDLITGADEEDTLLYIQKFVVEALRRGCFNLRKYRSNSKAIYQSDVVDSKDNLSISNSLNTLGLGWNSNTDNLHVSIQIPSSNVLTKRFILSSSFKIFDPLGLLSPCIIKPKLLLQLLWTEKLTWDEPVSDHINFEWKKFADNLHCLKSLDIPRRTLCDSPSSIELHSFSDASQSAYGACLYMRSLDSLGNVTVSLLCGKSKVAPIKPMTIPRLELCAALLSARLVKTTIDSLRCQNVRLIHWCDSSVVLGWLRANFSNLKTFVANRIVEICELTDANSWRYVPSSENPADLISRGVQPNEIVNMSLWWSGPSFLLKPECEWPQLIKNSDSTLPEIKSHTATINSMNSVINIENYSKLNKLKRIVAYAHNYCSLLYGIRYGLSMVDA